ncbi:MAG: DUF2336 domain-containing protein [Alphaproteobacteria bacterium]|jgi:uncharacterized protein (DUF2336 family)|nr:DUF2336 domain-containing protein [Alphaproteobacteria bacterium]
MSRDKDKIDRLLALASDPVPGSRAVVFQSMYELLLDPDQTQSEDERRLAGEILIRLIGEVETKLRQALAAGLARRDDVPRDLVKTLAFDDIEVAAPVLLNSPKLADTDLIEIIHGKAREHHLSIARRATVAPEVSQALIDTADTAVVEALLGNTGAMLGREALEFLIQESRWQHNYQEPLVRRADLPKALAARLYCWVAAPLREHLSARYDIDPELIDTQFAKVIADEMAQLARQRDLPSKSQALIDKLAQRGELTVGFLINALGIGETGLFEDGLIALSGLRRELVRRVIHDPKGDGLAVVARSVGAGLEEFTELFAVTRHGAGAPTAAAEQGRAAADLYGRITPGLARRVITLWRQDLDYVLALRVAAKET